MTPTPDPTTPTSSPLRDSTSTPTQPTPPPQIHEHILSTSTNCRILVHTWTLTNPQQHQYTLTSKNSIFLLPTANWHCTAPTTNQQQSNTSTLPHALDPSLPHATTHNSDQTDPIDLDSPQPSQHERPQRPC
eukprot:1810095-Rhodomonas_salina.1